MTFLAPVLQSFFTDRLISQRQASGHTIAAYRDTFQLLFRYTTDQTGRPPSKLDISDIDAPLIARFLDHLETVRHNNIRTRNQRLAALHSFYNYAALRHPEHAATIQRILAIPAKRHDRNLLTYLTDPEVDAFLDTCDRSTRTGRRDHAMFLLAIQTGLRISELIGLTRADINLDNIGAHVRCLGKGRKQRTTPLIPLTVKPLASWLKEQPHEPVTPLFTTNRGRPLSRDAIEHRVAVYTTKAATTCPSIQLKTVTAHTLRHTCAMRLLHAGNDITIIALWLGHAGIDTTRIYLHADMTQKEQAIARTTPPGTQPGRYQPPDTILAFLKAL